MRGSSRASLGIEDLFSCLSSTSIRTAVPSPWRRRHGSQARSLSVHACTWPASPCGFIPRRARSWRDRSRCHAEFAWCARLGLMPPCMFLEAGLVHFFIHEDMCTSPGCMGTLILRECRRSIRRHWGPRSATTIGGRGRPRRAGTPETRGWSRTDSARGRVGSPRRGS